MLDFTCSVRALTLEDDAMSTGRQVILALELIFLAFSATAAVFLLEDGRVARMRDDTPA